MTASIVPLSLRLLEMSRAEPRLFRMALRLMGFGARSTPGLGAWVAKLAVAAPDCALLDQPAFREQFMAMVCEAVRQGPGGTQQDLCLMVSSWGFRPEEIQVPVRLWHGEADKNAPIAMGRYLAGAMPHAVLTSLPGEGHLSVMAKNARMILKALTEAEADTP